MALNDMRDDWEKKIFSTIFSEKDTTSDEYCLSANMGPEYLYIKWQEKYHFFRVA